LAINLSDINTPIPRDSRIRLSIQPPKGQDADVDGFTNQYYSVVMTVYEEIVE